MRIKRGDRYVQQSGVGMTKLKSMRICSAFVAFMGLGVAQTGSLRAECYQEAPLRPVYRTFTHRDIEEPGVYSVRRVPSLYGWRERRVYQPGDVVWHEEAPVYRTVSNRVRVSHRWTWQRREVRGREIMCRVRVPAVYQTVERKVLVRPGHRWAERSPSSVGYVHERVLLRPYKNFTSYERPRIHHWRERVAVQPEGSRWRRTALRPDC